MEENFPDIVAAQPALLAQHCGEARLIEKAVTYWLKAGQQSLAHSAMIEAVAQLRKGLDFIGGLPDTIEREHQELEYHLILGSALTAAQGYAAPEVGEHFAQAVLLWKRLGKSSLLGWRVLGGLHEYHLVRAELMLACRDAEEIFELAQSQHDALWEAVARTCQATDCFWLGEFVAARTYLDHALERYDPKLHSIDAVRLAFDPVSLSLSYSYRSLFCLGYFDQAHSRRDEALSLARRLSHANTLALTLFFAIQQDAHAQLEPTLVLDEAEELAAVSADHGFPFWRTLADVYRGWCLSMLGRSEEGLALQTNAIMSNRTIGALLSVPLQLTMLAESYGNAGRPNEGLRQLEEAARLIEVTQVRMGEADLHRVRGELLISVGDPTAAEAAFQQAIAAAHRQNAKFWELRAATSLVRLWRDQGNRTEAHDLLAPIYGWFTEGFDTPVLKEAKALLDELP